MDAFEAAVSGEEGGGGEEGEKSSERIFWTRSRGAAWNAVDWPVVRQFSSTSLRHEKSVNCFFEMPEKPEGTVSSVVPHPTPSSVEPEQEASFHARWSVHSLTDSFSPILDSTANLERLVTWNSLSLSLVEFHSPTFEHDYFVIFLVNNDPGWLYFLTS